MVRDGSKGCCLFSGRHYGESDEKEKSLSNPRCDVLVDAIYIPDRLLYYDQAT